ncbi:MAG: monovalent cation/H(+) antiporter subunit G [Oscillospiraceae bacterium]|nr:monovalent cation/H(+) antiporter subunit G [Oscillospiraceae bacterium]
MIYAIYTLIGISVIFALAGVVGMLRFPDSFSRMQASTNISTFGVLGVILGGILYSLFIFDTPDIAMAVKLAVMGVFYIITNPIAGHAIAKAAYKKGIRPEKEMTCDKYGEDLENAD